MCPLIVAALTMLILIFLLSMIQEIVHWIIILGVRISINKYDVDDGISLDFSKAPDENITSCLQSAPPLTCIIL